LRNALIYLCINREMHKNFDAVYDEQNIACLEVAREYLLTIHGTYYDFRGRLYNERRKGLGSIFQRLHRGKPYCIIIQNISVISPHREIQIRLLEPFRRLKTVKFLEAETWDGGSDVLKQLGLDYNQLELDLAQLTEDRNV